MKDTLVAFGGEIKALHDSGDRMKIGGYLVLFGSPEQTDATEFRDFFTPHTDFDIPASGAKSTIYYHHGLNPALKKRKLGVADLQITDAGVWMEAELSARDDYEAKVLEMVRRNKLGLSSGTANHLMDRIATKNAAGERVHEITRWPLGLDASLTPTPGEPRTMARAIKSLNDLIEMEDQLNDDAIKRTPSKKLPAGHWITHNGCHVFIPDRQVNEDHVFAAGVSHDLSEAGHKVLDEAYKNDEIHTAAHLHLALAHAQRLRDGGMDDAKAVKQGLEKHGYNGTATHAEKYRDAVEAQKHAQLIAADKEAIQARKERIDNFRAVGQDVVDYISNHAQTYDEAQQMAKDLGYRHATWDDQASVRRREKARKSVDIDGEACPECGTMHERSEESKCNNCGADWPMEAKSLSLVPSKGMQAAAKNGLQRHADGESGDGLEPATVERARKIAAGDELTPDHVKRMHSFFSRHAGNRQEPGTPWYTAWQLWGGDAGQTWAANKAEALRDGDNLKFIEALSDGLREGLKFSEHSALLREAVTEYDQRFAGWSASFDAVKAGRAISADNHRNLCALHDAVCELHDGLLQLRDNMGDFLESHRPKGEADDANPDAGSGKKSAALMDEAWMRHCLLLSGVEI